MNWKLCKSKQPWPNSSYYPRIFWRDWGTPVVGSLIPGRNSNRHSPKYKSQACCLCQLSPRKIHHMPSRRSWVTVSLLLWMHQVHTSEWSGHLRWPSDVIWNVHLDDVLDWSLCAAEPLLGGNRFWGEPDASIFMYRDFLHIHLINARKDSRKYDRSFFHVLPSSSLGCFT
jgi:hypothetical protein